MAEASSKRSTIGAEGLLGYYANMVRIRAFEETAISAAKEGLLLGALHPSIGQEAVAVGVCGNLETTDFLLSTHRGHGHALAKGADPAAMVFATQRHHRDPHPQGLAGGGGAVVGNRVEAHVHVGVQAEMRFRGLQPPPQLEPFRGDAPGGEVVAVRHLGRRIGKLTGFQQQPGFRNLG